MSETTNKMRDVAIYSDSLIRVRDLAADAIEAVEAQVAEAVARVEKLEEMGRLGASPNGDDRTRGDMSPRGFDSPTPAAPTPPAPSAVPAPRGFRVGDKVRTDQGAEHTISDVAGDGYWLNGRLRESGIAYRWPAHRLTLVRAAAAPEAPAEDAGLVERLARIIVDTPCAANHEGQCIPPGAPVDDCDRANARAVLSDLTAESRLCAPGEVARLKDELAEANGARFLNANAVRLQKARAEAAEKALADANDRLTSQSRSIEEMHAEMVDLRAKLAAAEQALDVERRTAITINGNVRVFPTREARIADEKSIGDELRSAKAERDEALRAAGENTKELCRAWKERDALRAELVAAQGEMYSLRATISVLRADLAALRAKPRFRTRRITAADANAYCVAFAQSGRLDNASRAGAMNALGFRRRVDGGK